MPDTTADISALPDFLVDAHVLLTRAQECLSHLDLIGEDADACDCLVSTLGTLAGQAQRHVQPQIADFCQQLRDRLAPEPSRNRLHYALPTLQACLSLLAWQLELIDPHTGQLSLDNHEQLSLLSELETRLKHLPTSHTSPALPPAFDTRTC